MTAAAQAAVAGEEGQRGRTGKRKQRSCSSERKAAADEEQMGRATKRKAVGIGCSDSNLGSETAGAAKIEEEAPKKKMTRLPQAEVDLILALPNDDDHAPPCVKAWYRRNPGRRPTEEEDDTALLFIEIQEEFGEFQDWIRSEYDKNGYVEVDEDVVASRAQVQAWSDEAREAIIKGTQLAGGT